MTPQQENAARERARLFVQDFYARHGKAMSALAKNEDLEPEEPAPKTSKPQQCRGLNSTHRNKKRI